MLRRAPIWFDVDLSGIVCSGKTEIDLSKCLVEDDATMNFYVATVSNSGLISLNAARLTGHSSVRFAQATVSGGFLEFSEVVLEDFSTLVFDQVEVLDGGILGLHWAQFSGRSRVTLDGCVVESGGSVAGRQMALRGHAVVSLAGATVDAGEVRFEQTSITEDACLALVGAQVRSAELTLNDLVIADRGRLRLDKTRLSGDSTTLKGTTLRGGAITIGGARLEPASVSLPNGRWADTPATTLPLASTVQPDRIVIVVDPPGSAES